MEVETFVHVTHTCFGYSINLVESLTLRYSKSASILQIRNLLRLVTDSAASENLK